MLLSETTESAGESIRRLLGEVAPESFLRDYWDRQVLLRRGALAPETLLTVAEFERLVQGPALLRACQLQLRRADRAGLTLARSYSEAVEAFSCGFTLHVDSVQNALDLDHPVLRLTRQLSDWLQAPLRGISVFLSPEGAPGLPAHHDDEDIFTLQLDGRKSWQLYRRRQPGALASVAGVQSSDVADAKCVLSPGDLLYTPRRLPHEVHCLEGPSLSLGIALRSPSWGELLTSMLRQAAESEPRLCEAIFPAWLQPDATTLQALKERLGALVAGLDIESVAGALESQRKHRKRAPAPNQTAFEQASMADSIDADTPITLEFRGVELRDHGSHWVLHHHGGAFRVPCKALPSLRAMQSHTGGFCARDVSAGLTLDGRVALLRKLVRLGLAKTIR